MKQNVPSPAADPGAPWGHPIPSLPREWSRNLGCSSCSPQIYPRSSPSFSMPSSCHFPHGFHTPCSPAGARNPSDIFVFLTDGLAFKPNHAAGTGNVLIITQGVNCFPGRAFVSPSSAETATGKVNKCQVRCFNPEPRAFIKIANESNN